MKPFHKLLHALTAVAVMTLSSPLAAGDKSSGLVIPKAVKGTQCVEDTDVMRRDHMDYLKHHRDDTLRKGIRTKKYSLKECINCHVPEDGTSEAKQSAGNHFCINCHVYAGVKLDCFECHATKPVKSTAFHPIVTPAMQSIEEVNQPDSAELLNDLAEKKSETEAAQ